RRVVSVGVWLNACRTPSSTTDRRAQENSIVLLLPVDDADAAESERLDVVVRRHDLVRSPHAGSDPTVGLEEPRDGEGEPRRPHHRRDAGFRVEAVDQLATEGHLTALPLAEHLDPDRHEIRTALRILLQT